MTPTRIIKKIKSFFLRFFLIDDTPHKIAAGAALGVFWGIMPGEGVGTTIITATIFRFNRFAATSGVLATNFWTTFFILPIAAIMGGFFFKINPAVLIEDFKNTYQLGIKYFFSESIFSSLIFPLLVGFLITSLAISLFVYVVLYFLLKYRKVRFK